MWIDDCITLAGARRWSSRPMQTELSLEVAQHLVTDDIYIASSGLYTDIFQRV